MSGDSETVGGSSAGRSGRFGRGGQYRGRGGTRPSRSKHSVNAALFIRGSAEMLGHVFQMNVEQRKRGQFKDTLDIMRIYTLKNMQK